jgi:hypothetical protein
MVLRLPSSRDTPGGYIRKNTKETVLFYNIKINRPTPFGVDRFIIYSAFCNAHSFSYSNHINRAQAPTKRPAPQEAGANPPHEETDTIILSEEGRALYSISFFVLAAENSFPFSANTLFLSSRV